MSDIDSLSDTCEEQQLSETSSQFSLDVEDPGQGNALAAAVGGVDYIGPYMDEPLADDEWIKNYNRERREEEQQIEKLNRRLNGTEPLATWCKCGNCRVEHLENPKECQCCREVENCKIALHDPRVVQQLGVTPQCFIEHPGFSPVFLNEWTLQIMADQFKTSKRTRYKNLGSEKRFMRSVAYRSASRLIHGKLGKTRLPLPACVYNIIRETFQIPSETLTGFAEQDENAAQ
ncbi:uncharacterized protein LOC135694120 [Rhopilema esculentum]|uniref:uncharacterized protein LOC135694120 n=1 Tax=Rhopilema esculentum TaxID=499914 RepID=UPI0031E0B73B|eukprot:gene9962-18578_t